MCVSHQVHFAEDLDLLFRWTHICYCVLSLVVVFGGVDFVLILVLCVAVGC